MKKSILKVVVTSLAISSFCVANTAMAGIYWPAPSGFEEGEGRDGGSRDRDRDGRKGRDGGKKVASVPELDSAGAPIALALMAGVAGIALERRRSKKNK